MKVVFRVDASLEIGSGHIMRCLTLAQALRTQQVQCQFVCRAHIGHMISLVEKQGFAVTILPSIVDAVQQGPDAPVHASWVGADWQQDAQQTLDAVGGCVVQWLVVDHYGLDARWERTIRARALNVLAIDDLADRPHDCDLLLDQNLIQDLFRRYDQLLPATCVRLLGPQFALLQPQYKEWQTRAPTRQGPVRRILAYFGAADADNLSGLVVDVFAALGRPDVTLDLVINPQSPHADAIRAMVQGSGQIHLHENLPSLASLMVKADLAIGAGGATSWERCCLGLPALVVTLAENQKPIARELHRQGYIEWLGHKDAVTRQLLEERLAAMLDGALSLDWSERCRQLVDGHGVDRVALLLTLTPETPLQSRLARLDDETQVVQSAMALACQGGTVQPELIPDDEFRARFRQDLRDHGQVFHYMVETNTGLPVGQVLFTRQAGAWVILDAIQAAVQRVDGMRWPILQSALLALRSRVQGVMQFTDIAAVGPAKSRLPMQPAANTEIPGRMRIGICSDAGSWINASIALLVLNMVAEGHVVSWAHSAEALPAGDLCFYLSYGRIVHAQTRERYRHNLVVHASDLPKGRGWSPTSWLILAGAERIPVTLLEAVDAVDAGPIYLQEWLCLDGTELIDEWRSMLAASTMRLVRAFVSGFPKVLDGARQQAGEPTEYPRRRAADSVLDPSRSLASQFNQLRIVDNESYPAFFSQGGQEFELKIYKRARQR